MVSKAFDVSRPSESHNCTGVLLHESRLDCCYESWASRQLPCSSEMGQHPTHSQIGPFWRLRDSKRHNNENFVLCYLASFLCVYAYLIYSVHLQIPHQRDGLKVTFYKKYIVSCIPTAIQMFLATIQETHSKCKSYEIRQAKGSSFISTLLFCSTLVKTLLVEYLSHLCKKQKKNIFHV